MATSKIPGGVAAADPNGLAQGVVVRGATREIDSPIAVALTRSPAPPTEDQALWVAIRNRTQALSFDRYAAFIERVLCKGTAGDSALCGSTEPVTGYGQPSIEERRLELASRPSIYGVDSYQLLKLATHAFLLIEGGVSVAPPRDALTGTTIDTAPPVGEEPPPNSVFARIPDEGSRVGREITYAQAQTALQDYLATQVGGIAAAGLPYLKRVVTALLDDVDLGAEGFAQVGPYCDGALQRRLSCPALIELLWNYWWEECGLVQGMNAIALRFQNRRRGPSDPLATLALDPLRPMSNLLWGRLQDAPNQLSVSRRAYEYAQQYGLKLCGKAVDDLAPVENRSKFIEAFHTLLQHAAEFYRQDSNTTVIADGFALLQSLKQVHMVLAEGANNQFDELKRQARVEMMIDQWLLSRREMREFLRGRVMMPFPEAWMSQQDTLMRLHGWGEGTVTHFHYLASAGEMLLLSIRYADWMATLDQASAANWARAWRPEVQAYMHSYHAVTGVDLAAPPVDVRQSQVRFVPPSALLDGARTAAIGFSLQSRGMNKV